MSMNPFDDVLGAQDGPTASTPIPAPANPFDAIMRDVGEERRQRLRGAVTAADQTTPDAKAEAMKLSRETGIPIDTVERNLDDARRAAKLATLPYQQLLTETPHLAEWLAQDVNHAAVAADDMEQLGLLEWITTAPQRAFQQAIDQDRVSRLRMKELLVGDLTRAEQDQLNASKFHMQNGGKLGAGDSWFRNAVTGAAQLLVNIGAGTARGVEKGVQYAGTAAGFGGAASLASGGALAPEAAAFVGSAFTAGTLKGALDYGFQIEAGGAYDEFLDFKDETGRPIDKNAAKAAAIAAGAINSGLEAFGLHLLAKSIPGLDRLSSAATRDAIKAALRVPTIRAALADAVGTYGKTLTGEVATEVAQRAVTILSGELAKVGSGQDIAARSPGDIATDLTQEAVGATQSFALGVAGGPAMHVAGSVTKAKEASQSKAFFDALGEGLQNSKTFQRAPEAVEQLIKRAAENGPTPAVYAPAETWVQYWQSQNVDPRRMAETVMGDGQALDDALASGGDLRIPTERYAATIAATEHNAFFANELRLEPDAMNGREEEAYRQQQEEETRKLAAAQQQPAAPSPLEQLRAALVEDLVTGGKFDQRTAETYATLVEQGLGTLATDAGLDPFKVFQRYYAGTVRPELGLKTVPLTAARPAAQTEGPHATPAEGARPHQPGSDALVRVAESRPSATENEPYQIRRRAGESDRALGARRLAAVRDARSERYRQHYDTLFNYVAAHAQQIDPAVDVEQLRREFDARRDLHAEAVSYYTDAGHDPMDLLRTLARNGGIGIESEGGLTGERRWLMESPHVVAGRAHGLLVFPKRGLSFDVALQNLHQDDRFKWIETTDDLMDAIHEAINHEALHNENVFPGSDTLTRDLGIDVDTKWWTDSRVTPDAPTAETDAHAGDHEGDITFNPGEFAQMLFDELRDGLEGEPVETEKVDTLDTGEQQPRLPGAGDVRDQNVATPQMEAPFALTSEVAKTKKGQQTTLFQGAYHGSPHIFEKFSLQAIGTGEGAQAYGWGLYFASKKEVAEGYRERLTQSGLSPNERLLYKGKDAMTALVYELQAERRTHAGPDVEGNIPERAAEIDRLLDGLGELYVYARSVGALQYARDYFESKIGDAARDRRDFEARGKELPPHRRALVKHYENALEAIAVYGDDLTVGKEGSPGRTYKVEIPEDEDFLDWDQPASQQSPKVQAALRALGIDWETFHPMTLEESRVWFNSSKAAAALFESEDIAVREAMREGWSQMLGGNKGALEVWQRQHQEWLPLGTIDPTGADLYDRIANLQTDAAPAFDKTNRYASGRQLASEALAAQGLAGIRYLDGFSRGSGEGSHNYVVFDDQLVQLVEYDQPPDYQGTHAPPGPRDGAPAHDLTGEGRIYPDDVYSDKGPRFYGTGDDALDRKTFRILSALKGKPDAEVTIYRAVPVDVAQTDINPGDWVTLNRKYAEDHGLRFADTGGEGEAFRILEKTVKASDIFTNGDSIQEWGFWPGGVETFDQIKRGSITIGPDRKMAINLFANADPSTFLHEMGHFFLEIFSDLAEQVQAIAEDQRTPGQHRLLANYKAALEALGVDNRSQIGREHHEKWATLFEAYLMEGKAPSEELRTVFSRFRAWMLGIYQALTKLNARLTPEVRQIFDRMLATDEAIAAAERRAQMAGMFLTAEMAGMTPERFELYRDTIERAHRTATEELDAKLQSEVRREQTATWRARRAEIRETVATEVYAEPVYNALAAIRRGTRPDGSPLEEGFDPQPMKLSRALIAERFGEDRLRSLPAFVISKQGGLDPNVVAELFGFDGGDALLTAISEAPAQTKKIEQETDRRMIQEHGSLLLSGDLSAKAQEAAANTDRDLVIREELRALARLRQTVAPFVAQARGEERQARDAAVAERDQVLAGERERAARARKARDRAQQETQAIRAHQRAGVAALRSAVPSDETLRDVAQDRIAKTVVKALTPATYLSAMRRAADAAAIAAGQQDFDEAIRQKTLELLNLHLFREAEKARSDSEARATFARELLTGKQQQKIGKAGHTWLEQVNGILDRYEFAKVPLTLIEKRARLADWLEAMEAEGLPVDQLPQEVRDDARRINYKELPYEQLVGVTDGLKMLVHFVTMKNRLLKAEGDRDFAARKTALLESIAEHNTTKDLPVEFGPAEDRARKIGEWFASHVKLATLARAFDGHKDNGLFWQAFALPMNLAQDAEQVQKREAFTGYRAVLEKHYPGRQLASLKEKTVVAGVGPLSLEARLAVALNWGNETSRQRILSDPRRTWSRSQVQAILESLSDNDLDFVQETWDFIGQWWPQIAAKQERVTGLAPEKVEASTFTVRDKTLAGGYYPLVYDGRLNARTAQHEAAQDAKSIVAGAYARSTTRRGHVEQRKKNVTLSVRLDLDVTFNHLEQVIHDLTHHEALIDVMRLLRDRDIQDAIYNTRGEVAYRQLTRVFQDAALGSGPTNAKDNVARFMKTGAQVAGLGWNFWTAAQQPLGLFNGMSRVGPTWVAKGLKRMLRDAVAMENTLKWVVEQSAFMRERHQTGTQDIAELRQALRKPGGWFDTLIRTVTADHLTQQHILDSFLWMIGFAQRFADAPTWLGGYEKAMASGVGHERAVQLADQAVIDSQGSGRLTDLSEKQRGGDVAKLFLTFYSYGATVYNSTSDVVGATDFKSPSDITKLLGHLSLLYFLPALGTVAMANAFGRRDDDGPDEWAQAIAGEMLSTALNTMMWVRELSGLARDGQGVRGYEGPAGARTLQTLYRAAGQLKQGKADEALVKALNQAAGVIFRYPAAQVERTTEGWVALEEGKTHNPAALLFGAPKKGKK